MAKVSEFRRDFWLDQVGFPEQNTKLRDTAIRNLTALQKNSKTNDQEKIEIAEAITAIKRGWPYK